MTWKLISKLDQTEHCFTNVAASCFCKRNEGSKPTRDRNLYLTQSQNKNVSLKFYLKSHQRGNICRPRIGKSAETPRVDRSNGKNIPSECFPVAATNRRFPVEPSVRRGNILKMFPRLQFGWTGKHFSPGSAARGPDGETFPRCFGSAPTGKHFAPKLAGSTRP